MGSHGKLFVEEGGGNVLRANFVHKAREDHKKARMSLECVRAQKSAEKVKKRIPPSLIPPSLSLTLFSLFCGVAAAQQASFFLHGNPRWCISEPAIMTCSCFTVSQNKVLKS